MPQNFHGRKVPYPLGREDIGSKEDLVDAIAQMRMIKPSIKQVMVKLNEGVSGEGNAIIDLTGVACGRGDYKGDSR